MSTAAVSSQSIYQEIQSFYQSRSSDVKQLGSALKSGDLSGAQQAYSELAALGEEGPFANSEPFAGTSRSNDFNAIGEALQAGDLTRAQTDFAALTAKTNASTSSSSSSSQAAVVNLSSTQSNPSVSAADDTSSIYQQLQAYHQQRTADLNQLGQDIAAGNLTAAQQDYSTLTALGQSGPFADGQTFRRADRSQDFQAIGAALQSGDLTGAQTAFTSLAATFSSQKHAPSANPPAAVAPAVAQATVSTVAPAVASTGTDINLNQPKSYELIQNLQNSESTTLILGNSGRPLNVEG